MPDFEEIYRLYFADVYKYILALSRNEAVAEEVTQETFFRALSTIGTFRGTASCGSSCARSPETGTWTSAGSGGGSGIVRRSRWPLALRRVSPTGTPPNGSTRFSTSCRSPTRRSSPADLRELSFAHIGELFQKSESWARVTYFRARQKLKEGLDEL